MFSLTCEEHQWMLGDPSDPLTGTEVKQRGCTVLLCGNAPFKIWVQIACYFYIKNASA